MKTLLTWLVILICALGCLLAVGGEGTGSAALRLGEGSAQKRKITFEINFAFLLHGVTRSVYFCALVPQTDRFRQTVGVEYSIEPDNVFSDGMTRYAVWFFQEPQDSFQLSITVNAEISRRDLATIRAGNKDGSVEDVDIADEETLKEFIIPEKWIECDDEEIVAAAQTIPDGDDEIATAQKVFDFVRAKVKYSGYNASNCGAKKTLAHGFGDCTEYSDLFVALLRAKKIPARVVSGWVSEWTEEGSGKHNWAEFHSSRYGWIPVDVLLADLERTAFDTLPNMFVYFTQKRNDEQNPDFCFWRVKVLGDRVTVEGECRILAVDGEARRKLSKW